MDVLSYTVEAYNFLLELAQLLLVELLQPAPLLALLVVIASMAAIPVFYLQRQRRRHRPARTLSRHEPTFDPAGAAPARQPAPFRNEGQYGTGLDG